MKATNFSLHREPKRKLCITVLILLSFSGPMLSLMGAAFTPTFESYGHRATINPAVYSEVTLRKGDWILYPSTTQPAVQGSGVATITPIGSNMYKIQADPSITTQTIKLTSGFTIKVQDFVWPGDANADGIRNTLDLFPVAMGIRGNITTNTVCTPLTYTLSPPSASLNAIYAGNTCNHSPITINGVAISYRHADCNMDGAIDQLDAEIVLALVRPMYLPDLLHDQINGLALDATFAGAGSVTSAGLSPAQNPLYKAPFNITVQSTPGNAPIKVLGVVFSRAVGEGSTCPVYEISADFSQSQVITNPAKYLRGQTFWRGLMQMDEATPCGNLTENVLDVGVFSTDSTYAATLVASDNVLTCGVTLEDVMAGQSPCPIIGAVYNTAVFIANADGTYSVQVTECSGDTTWYTPEPVKRPVYIQDHTADNAVEPSRFAPGQVSPDIFVRAKADGLTASQNPVPGTVMQVHVRAHNSTSNPVTAMADVYWMYADGSKSWASAFTGSSGGKIGTVKMEIAAGSSSIKPIAWTVPVKGKIPASFTFVAVVRKAGEADPVSSFRGPVNEACTHYSCVAQRNTYTLSTVNATPKASDRVSYVLTVPASDVPLNLVVERVNASKTVVATPVSGRLAPVAAETPAVATGGQWLGAELSTENKAVKTEGWQKKGSVYTLGSTTSKGSFGGFKAGETIILVLHSEADSKTKKYANEVFMLSFVPATPTATLPGSTDSSGGRLISIIEVNPR